MYKLTVVDGPSRGTSYAIQDGENWIGRQAGNAVILQSAKISKKHCVLIAENGELIVKDQGSSNGTFVNGVLTKLRKVGPGDRISVGEYVLEISEPPSKVRQAQALPNFGKVVQMPKRSRRRSHRVSEAPAIHGLPGVQSPALPSLLPGGNMENQSPPIMSGPAIPNDLPGKLNWYFEHYVMPFFYGLALKYEWKMIALSVVGAFVVSNLIFTVYPLLESSREAVVKESARRATYIAREIAAHNAPFIAASQETKAEIGLAEGADGVRLALLVDLDNRIIAPAAKLNQYLHYGREALFAVRARNLFQAGRESGITSELDSSTVAAVEPVKILSANAGKNEIVAMAVVSIDTSIATPDIGEMGVIYSETLILTGIVALLVFFILYRMTLKPFLVLSDDMDKVLKGDMTQVTHEFKIEELNPLWDLINSALQRASRSSGQADSGMGDGPAPEDFASPFRLLAAVYKFGIVVCDGDKRIIYMNPIFEEISGIRADTVIGQDIPSVARDQALGALANDLFDRTIVGAEAITEDFDFSGISYKMHAAAFGPSGGPAKAFVLAAIRAEGG